MYWANILHIYQPPTQTHWMVEKIANESYREIIRVLNENAEAKITLNISGCLTEKLAELKFFDIIEGFRTLAQRGQIEFTGSSAYHSFLPLTPEKEVRRQIELNEEINKKYFGDAYAPNGFFSPEGGYSNEVANIIKSYNYTWLLVDEVSFSGNIRSHNYRFEVLPHFYSGGRELHLDEFMFIRDDPKYQELIAYDQLYTLEDMGKNPFYLFFRERYLSDAIASGQIKNAQTFYDLLGEEMHKKRYFLTATDGEAYGHHNPGLENFLHDVFQSDTLQTVTVSELITIFGAKNQSVTPLRSTWASSGKEIAEKNYYSRWKHINNEIHEFQWQLTRVAIRAVEQAQKELEDTGVDLQSKEEKAKAWHVARKQLDRALYSCHFWWASARPWWSIEMIEAGAYELFHVIELLPECSSKQKNLEEGHALYSKVVFTSFTWMRSGKVRDLSRLHDQ